MAQKVHRLQKGLWMGLPKVPKDKQAFFKTFSKITRLWNGELRFWHFLKKFENSPSDPSEPSEMEVVFLRKALFPRPRGLPSIFFLVGDGTSRGDASSQHGVSNSREAVVTTIPKRMEQKSQTFGTGIPSVWDGNPKRLGHESQTHGTDSGYSFRKKWLSSCTPLLGQWSLHPLRFPRYRGTEPPVCRGRATFVS